MAHLTAKGTSMDFLDFVPAPVFETIGTMTGLTSCTVVLVQLIKEWQD